MRICSCNSSHCVSLRPLTKGVLYICVNYNGNKHLTRSLELYLQGIHLVNCHKERVKEFDYEEREKLVTSNASYHHPLAMHATLQNFVL